MTSYSEVTGPSLAQDINNWKTRRNMWSSCSGCCYSCVDSSCLSSISPSSLCSLFIHLIFNAMFLVVFLSFFNATIFRYFNYSCLCPFLYAWMNVVFSYDKRSVRMSNLLSSTGLSFFSFMVIFLARLLQKLSSFDSHFVFSSNKSLSRLSAAFSGLYPQPRRC